RLTTELDAGQVLTWAFEGMAGDIVLAAATGIAPVGLEIHTPDGDILALVPLADGLTQVELDLITLPTSGTYILVVRGTPGDVVVELQRLAAMTGAPAQSVVMAQAGRGS
ncbi:MAG: hypothetical protein GYB65_02805, partial [Chloroflexi bacterium]|nr:hypothetical protein [Chloroflexota bacterium]